MGDLCCNFVARATLLWRCSNCRRSSSRLWTLAQCLKHSGRDPSCRNQTTENWSVTPLPGTFMMARTSGTSQCYDIQNVPFRNQSKDSYMPRYKMKSERGPAPRNILSLPSPWYSCQHRPSCWVTTHVSSIKTVQVRTWSHRYRVFGSITILKNPIT